MHCRRKDNVDETVQALRDKGLQVSGVVCHVGNAQHRSSLIKQTIQVRQHLHVCQVRMSVRSSTCTIGGIACSVQSAACNLLAVVRAWPRGAAQGHIEASERMHLMSCHQLSKGLCERTFLGVFVSAQEYGQLDILISNAAVRTRPAGPAACL
jgi:hypothetical protein